MPSRLRYEKMYAMLWKRLNDRDYPLHLLKALNLGLQQFHR